MFYLLYARTVKLITCLLFNSSHNIFFQEKFAAHGYGSFFILSTLDRYYREDMTKDEAVELLKLCIREVQSRFIVNLNAFSAKVCTARCRGGVWSVFATDLNKLRNCMNLFHTSYHQFQSPLSLDPVRNFVQV